MRIYTRRGDGGKTDLWSSSERVSKTSARIEAYGAIDELIGLLGVASVEAEEGVRAEIEVIQNQLHVMMAELADREGKGEKSIDEGHVERLEEGIDAYNETLEDIDSFLLPGGSEAGSLLHYSRAVCRRVERRIVGLYQEEEINPLVLNYINRLSDFLFVLARVQNGHDGAEEKDVDYR